MEGRKRIAVAGATGRLGRHVADLLAAEGREHEVVPIARSAGVDLITGEGLDEALEGVEVVVDAATGPSPVRQEAEEFFVTAARHLHEAGLKAGVRHIVGVSVIGIEGAKTGYNAAKVAHEHALLAGPVPVTVLRAAQFHELVGQMVEWGTRGEVAYVTEMRTQLVAARTVAEEVVRLATGPVPEPGTPGPGGAPLEVAGPWAESMVEAARLLVARRGGGVRVERVSDPADPDREFYEEGGLLPGSKARLAGPTFGEWLAAEGA